MKNEQIRFGQFRADSINEEERTAEFVISTEAVDSYGTVFKADGWDLSRYNSNPVVTYQHEDWSSDPDMVIGTSEVRIEGKQLIAKVYFENGEDNRVAEKVYKKVKNKILRGASIRFGAAEGHYGMEEDGEDPKVLYFTRQVLMAWSIVVVPSNHETLTRNEKNLENIRMSISQNTGSAPDENSDGTHQDNDTPEENKTLSRFEAQIKLNKNKSLK